MNKIWGMIQGKYQKFSSREKLIFYFATLALGALILQYLVAQPLMNKFNLLNQQIQAKSEKIRTSLRIVEKKERIMKESKEYEAYSEESRNPTEEKNLLIKELQKIAEANNVALLFTKPTKDEETGYGKKYYATLEGEADMENVASFFHSLENSTKLFTIEKYDIEPKSKESSIARCAMTVSKLVLIPKEAPAQKAAAASKKKIDEPEETAKELRR